MAELEDLLVPNTKEQIEQDTLALAEAQDLPVTAWGASSFFRVLFSVFATLLATVWFAIAQTANGLLLAHSRGGWLTLLARNYGEERLPPTFTFGAFLLTDGGAGPHGPIAAGALTVAVGDLQYTNQDEITIPASGSISAAFRALATGAKYNVPNNSECTLVTSVPTVTVTNPAVGTTGTWLTTPGTDVESDAALKRRLSAKWATLSTGSPAAAYLYWALSTSGVTRAKVDDGNPDGPGTLRVYVDNATSVAALQATLAAKAPSGTVATATAATAEAITVSGVLTVAGAQTTEGAAISAAAANLATLASEIDIGGQVIKAEVTQRLMDVAGAFDFQFGSDWAGSPNIQLAADKYPQFTLAITVVVQ